MKTKITLPHLLESSAEKKILLLGREGLFSQKEIERFLKPYKITLVTAYEENVLACIEHSMLNPLEEEISNTLYEKGIALYPLDELEKLISLSLNDDEILMGIKLSNDQERIFRLLGNEHIPESLFVKLLALYEWDDEEEDSREDRDVIMYTLKRYIDIKPNEADLLYSYLTLRRLATEATDPKLLLALVSFPNFSFLIRGREKVSLRETIARNTAIDEALIAKLVSLRDAKVDVALACNRSVALPLLQILLDKEEAKVNEALATNSNIDNLIFSRLLKKEHKCIQLLLLTQTIDEKRLSLIEAEDLEAALFATLGANEPLDTTVIEKLIAMDNERLLVHLSSNQTLSAAQLKKLYEKKLPKLHSYMAANPSCSIDMLEHFYHNNNTLEMQIALAHNPGTPESILRALFEKENFDIHRAMASNASVPMELLDILKVDTRLQNELAQNEIFVKAYNTVLDYDKKAVQF